MKSQKRQSGFSVIEALIIVLVVIILVGSGVVVFHRLKSMSTKHTTAKSAADTSQSQTTSSSQSDTTTQPAQATTQYLTIKEWGVKLPLSNGISDAYYVVDKAGSLPDANGPLQMNLGFKSLDSSECPATPNSAPVLLFRAPPTELDPVSGKPISQEVPGVTIGNYFYGYSLLKGGACNNEAIFQTLEPEMTAAVKGVVPVTN